MDGAIVKKWKSEEDLWFKCNDTVDLLCDILYVSDINFSLLQ